MIYGGVKRQYYLLRAVTIFVRSDIVILKNLSALACITVIGMGTAQATNVVVDISQVVDYTVYQTDLQQR